MSTDIPRDDPDKPKPRDHPQGLNVRVLAPTVHAITNVTALVGRDLEPLLCHIYIRDGLIAAIVPDNADTTPLAAAPPPAKDLLERSKPITIDGKHMIAMPGMVDVHDHLRVLAPGLPVAEGLPLDEFLKVQWATQAHMAPDDYEVAALLGSLQRMKCGVTTVVDHAYTFHEPDLDVACVSAYESSGIRWAYARGIMTRPYAPVCETFEEAADNIRSLLTHTAVTPDRLFVAPVSIRQASFEEFERSAALAEELGAGTYTHASETEAERETWLQEANATPITALDRAGFLTDRTVLAHCVILDDDEIELLAARGCHVVHCPSNNMKLAKGVTRVPDLLAAGVNVALGVDMMADIFSEMRAELHMQSLHSGDPAVLSSLDVLQMATWRGAAAAFSNAAAPADSYAPSTAGQRVAVGELSPGCAADIVLVPARSLLQAPMLDPVHAVVHQTQGPMVRHVLVDGQLVVADGVSTLVDEQELMFEAERACNFWLDQLDLPTGPQGVWFPPPALEFPEPPPKFPDPPPKFL
ncbi:MAG: amidohydrolase family protein [Acidimicrobiaceae bacterium]|nr:amidohydrolase family protein [Acidimicrobiaceae bacterium]MYE08257.1 amidohydrolase family protein [Acidimicrobiaceae bacterium]MYI37217.1 amidohydrolase family protein [Acidimicrobiaceae bacterium]